MLVLNDNSVLVFFYESLKSKCFLDNLLLSSTLHFSCWSKERITHTHTLRGAKAKKGGLEQVNLK